MPSVGRLAGLSRGQEDPCRSQVFVGERPVAGQQVGPHLGDQPPGGLEQRLRHLGRVGEQVGLVADHVCDQEGRVVAPRGHLLPVEIGKAPVREAGISPSIGKGDLRRSGR